MSSDLALAPHVAASLQRFRAALADRFAARLRRVVLFGSHARGDAHEESDVDVLVVVDELSDVERREVIDLAYDADAADRAHWAGLSPLGLSTQRFDEMRDRELLIVRDLEREGIAL